MERPRRPRGRTPAVSLLNRSAAPRSKVELILRGIDAANRRDPDAFVACLDRDVEWEETGDPFPGLRGICRGREEVRRWFEEAFGEEIWESSYSEAEEIIEAGDDRVLLGYVRVTRGKASGAETRLRGWSVFCFANGKIARREGPVWSRDEALDALL